MVRAEVHVGPLEGKGCAWGHAEGAGVIFFKLLALDDGLQTVGMILEVGNIQGKDLILILN